MAPHILLLGPPGAGKGTQSERLAEAFDVDHVSTGDMLRANKDMETEYGTPREFMEAGELVPDEVMEEVVKAGLADADGFVLDGYPRTLPQAEFLADITDLDVVLYLDVSEAEVVRRLSGRRVCAECDATYHVEFDPPEEEGVCDVCGGELVQRDDDTEETIRTRLDEYREKTEPVVEFYREESDLVAIDGEQPPDDVWADVRAAVEARVDGI